MLFNEPKLLKHTDERAGRVALKVSVLFNEPKLLKSGRTSPTSIRFSRFSALQRAEIAETRLRHRRDTPPARFSALQRAEIAET